MDHSTCSHSSSSRAIKACENAQTTIDPEVQAMADLRQRKMDEREQQVQSRLWADVDKALASAHRDAGNPNTREMVNVLQQMKK